MTREPRVFLQALWHAAPVTSASNERTVRVLHTSDVHIGLVCGPGTHHHEVCHCPVHALVDAAERHAVDLLLIAGDLFEHNRLEEHEMAPTFEALAACSADVLVIAGNHDAHDKDSPWGADASHPKRAAVEAAGVHFIDEPDGDTVTFDHLDLTVWGRALVEHEVGYRPLAGVPARPSDGWFVVAGHGHPVRGPEDLHRSSPITRDDIAATRADYVALGHVHVTTDMSAGGVPAWYPGAPMGRPSSQTAALVELTVAPSRAVAGRQRSALDQRRAVAVSHVPVTPPPHGCVPGGRGL